MSRIRRRRNSGDPRRVQIAEQGRSKLQSFCEGLGLRLAVRNHSHHWIVTGFNGELRVDWWPSTARAVRGNSADRFNDRKKVCDPKQLMELVEQEIEEIHGTANRRARAKVKPNPVASLDDQSLMLAMFNAQAQKQLDGGASDALAGTLAQLMSVEKPAPVDVFPHADIMAAAAKKFEGRAAAARSAMAELPEQPTLLAAPTEWGMVKTDTKPRKPWLRWPRGRYNGQRIVGISIKFKINVREWRLKPVTTWRTTGGIHWLCVMSWWNFNFED